MKMCNTLSQFVYRFGKSFGSGRRQRLYLKGKKMTPNTSSQPTIVAETGDLLTVMYNPARDLWEVFNEHGKLIGLVVEDDSVSRFSEPFDPVKMVTIQHVEQRQVRLVAKLEKGGTAEAVLEPED